MLLQARDCRQEEACRMYVDHTRGNCDFHPTNSSLQEADEKVTAAFELVQKQLAM